MATLEAHGDRANALQARLIAAPGNGGWFVVYLDSITAGDASGDKRAVASGDLFGELAERGERAHRDRAARPRAAARVNHARGAAVGAEARLKA